MQHSGAIPNKIAFLGFGKMGQAIAAGLKASEPALEVGYFDLLPAPAESGVQRFDSAAAAEEFGEVVLLCVKPADMTAAVGQLKGDKKYISIAAGLSVAQIRAGFLCSHDVQIARVMPNISALIGAAVSAVYCQDDRLRELTLALFGRVGKAVRIDKEDLMHAVTGLSGSGPAFVFAFVQALAEGGVLAGLSYTTALELASHTVRAAADMLVQNDAHPGELRNAVTSPGGTTIAGLKALEDRGFAGGVMDAVQAAARRSRELGS